jgi:hypothetical protein
MVVVGVAVLVVLVNMVIHHYKQVLVLEEEVEVVAVMLVVLEVMAVMVGTVEVALCL